jgi:hypothetical protein
MTEVCHLEYQCLVEGPHKNVCNVVPHLSCGGVHGKILPPSLMVMDGVGGTFLWHTEPGHRRGLKRGLPLYDSDCAIWIAEWGPVLSLIQIPSGKLVSCLGDILV